MARTPGDGGARPVTAEGFNEHIKRLFEAKRDSEQAPERRPGKNRYGWDKPTTGV